jgi:hypothetical protein
VSLECLVGAKEPLTRKDDEVLVREADYPERDFARFASSPFSRITTMKPREGPAWSRRSACCTDRWPVRVDLFRRDTNPGPDPPEVRADPRPW